MTIIRKALIRDVKAVHGIIMRSSSNDDGMVLPRAFNHLYSHLRDFYVAVNEAEEVMGCVALQICWEDLAEVRSLVVAREHRGKGLGKLLVEACLSEALTLGIFKVFVLTNQTSFFGHLGFGEVGKDSLPQKVWADCLNCPKFPDCDETAMVMEL